MSLPLVSETLLTELSQRGEAIYEKQLKSVLEKEHYNEYVVIHVDSGDYAVSKSFTIANREILARHPADGRLFGREIGTEPDRDFLARLIATEDHPALSK
jgi:hypothetical protein